MQGPVAVELALPAAGPVDVNVYDVRGALVRELVTSELPAGRHHIEWNRTNRSGDTSDAGVYFVRARAGGRTMTARFVVLP